MGLTVNDCVPEAIVVTDGSGTEVGTESQGTGGFSTVVITATTVTVVLGYSAQTTSGQMEITGVLEGLEVATTLPGDCRPKHILSLSDYESWIKADVDNHRASAAAGLVYPHMWHTLIQGLESWVQHELQISRRLYRHHTKAHVDEAGDWAQNLNQLCDHLAYTVKVPLPAVVLRVGPRNWHCPPSTVVLSPWEVGQYLTGPLTVGEWEHAITTRTSTAKDTDGLYYGLYRAAGPDA
jgi:hypothetical protein